MPGSLASNSCCPACGENLAAIVRTQSLERVVAEYYHLRAGYRRRPRCKVIYPLPAPDEVMHGVLRRPGSRPYARPRRKRVR